VVLCGGGGWWLVAGGWWLVAGGLCRELGFFYGEVGLLLAVGVLLWARVLYVIISYSLDPMRAGLHGYLLRHALLVAMFVGVMVVLFTYRLYQIFDDPPFFFQARSCPHLPPPPR
jgi:hypothetical protein